MEITLRIENKDKTFVNDFVPARLLRDGLKLNEEIAKKKQDGQDSVIDSLDEMAEFTVKAFNHQFTLDELWDGMELNKFQEELGRVFNNVLGLGGYALVDQETDSGGKSEG
ncbi:phage tail assembly chaperone G [Bacillus sp. CGMCC 1.16607]|uniref:phage tail assembly chaperone G n=1 Tax=Bacillus sp. CGMCC 1.16607 TaxID=3351842 RepID=UPI00363E2B6E